MPVQRQVWEGVWPDGLQVPLLFGLQAARPSRGEGEPQREVKVFVGTEFERAGGCAGTHGSHFHPARAILRPLEAVIEMILSLPSAGSSRPGQQVGATLWTGQRVTVPSALLLTFCALNILG